MTADKHPRIAIVAHLRVLAAEVAPGGARLTLGRPAADGSQPPVAAAQIAVDLAAARRLGVGAAIRLVVEELEEVVRPPEGEHEAHLEAHLQQKIRESHSHEPEEAAAQPACCVGESEVVAEGGEG